MDIVQQMFNFLTSVAAILAANVILSTYENKKNGFSVPGENKWRLSLGVR
jgi:hypothetical protein